MQLFLVRLVLFLLLFLNDLESSDSVYNNTNNNHTILLPEVITKPGCQSKCGDLIVPYPFGIISEGLNCSINPSFGITCNYSTNPPKAFIKESNLQILDISDTELRIHNRLAYRCYNESGDVSGKSSFYIRLWGTSFTYSKANVFTVVGCDDYANIYSVPEEGALPKGCSTTCQNIEEVPPNECSGSGCCQVSINVLQYFEVFLKTYKKHGNISSFNPCGYAFLGEKRSFKFQGISDLKDPNFMNRTRDTVLRVLDWVIGNKSCTEAAQDLNSYACKFPHSYCINGMTSIGGYRCSCKEGYEGNPYLSPGCSDIDECKIQENGGCKQICNNIPGSYSCSCEDGYLSDGKFDCTAQSSKSQPIKFMLGIGFGCLSIIIGVNWLYCIIRKRKHSQLRKNLFMQNGGLLLRQQTISEGGNFESKLFTYEELKKATNNYAADMVLGQGGYGIVYKGILLDQRVVAIKKSKVMDKSQIEQFINEVVILTQVNHRNVVKLLGCCLECEVPLLVYEYVSNGTLMDHVHNTHGGGSWLSLENRLRIAAESSGALAYLHSAASIPIMHRDIKLANILLDDLHVSKISDFGASRLIPMDQTEVTTLVQGTIGYLDPEYFHTGQLTDKSDVYSFGVVLAELLTGRKPICMANSPEERNLATYFITSLKENRLYQILEPRILKEGSLDQLEKAAELVKRCLKLSGDKRPTMKEVTIEIENLRKFTKHPWANRHDNEETTSFIGQTELPYSDLYEIQQSSYHNVVNDSLQYISSTISLLHPPTSPR